MGWQITAEEKPFLLVFQIYPKGTQQQKKVFAECDVFNLKREISRKENICKSDLPDCKLF